MSERKTGALLSYISTILNSAISIFLTPFILTSLGEAEYGIYRSVQALTGQLAMVSIGIGTISAVIVAKNNARNDSKVKEEKENFYATAMSVSFGISMLILAVSCILFIFIGDIYKSTLSYEQIKLVQSMFILLAINVALYQFRDVFVGFVNGHEKFIYSSGIKVIRLLLRVLLIVFLLKRGYKAISLAIVDLVLSIVLILLDVMFCFTILKIRPKFHCFDKVLFKSIFTFSLALFLQTIVNQINQNLDSVILGAMIQPERVAVYSLGLTIYVAFNSLTSSVANLFTPEAARLVQKNAATSDLMKFTIRVGRYQFLLSALVVGGFISIGKEFILLWVGNGKGDVYYITLILMIPMAFALLLSGANSILDVYMKRLGRSIILICTAALNLVISIALIPVIDYWGAAIGTATSVIIGQIIFMSIHYDKIFGFDILQFARSVMKGILVCTIISIMVTFPINYIIANNTFRLLVKGIVYTISYCIGIYFFGANETEKIMMQKAMKRVIRR